MLLGKCPDNLQVEQALLLFSSYQREAAEDSSPSSDEQGEGLGLFKVHMTPKSGGAVNCVSVPSCLMLQTDPFLRCEPSSCSCQMPLKTTQEQQIHCNTSYLLPPFLILVQELNTCFNVTHTSGSQEGHSHKLKLSFFCQIIVLTLEGNSLNPT